MSELKAFVARKIDDGTCAPVPCIEVYPKSEADKVIAEKDKEIAELKEIDSKNRSAYYKDLAMMAKDVEHHKYKRCLAMAGWCETNVYNIRRKPLCDMDDHEGWQHDDEFWQRWHKRWPELAEKFKGATR